MSEPTGPTPSGRPDGPTTQAAPSGRPDGPTTQAAPSGRPDGLTQATSSGRPDGRTQPTGSGRPDGSTQAMPVTSPGTGPAGSRQVDAPARQGGDRRPSVPRPTPTRTSGDPRPAASARGGRTRRAKLALRRIEPWSVFLFSFLGSIGLGIVLLVAVTALYAMLSALGVIESLNSVVSEIDPGGGPDSAGRGALLSLSRALGIAAVLAAINVVLLTALATLGALLYNVCASFTGGIELTLAEKD